jgi:hypothetical protein
LDRFDDSTAMKIATALGALAVLLFPIAFPLMALLNYHERRRMRQVADAALCEFCGGLLGLEALDIARERERRLAKERSRRGRGIYEVYVLPGPDAICAQCGAEYDFNLDTKEFVLKLRRYVDGMRCPSCRHYLNETAVDLAATKCRKTARTIIGGPVARDVDAICPQCHVGSAYEDYKLVLRPEFRGEQPI